MGYRVVVLDPFGLSGFETDGFNPFDLFSLPGSMLESDAEMITAQLGEGRLIEDDLFWNDQADSLVAGVIAAIQTVEEPGRRSLVTLREKLFNEDVVYNLAVYLDKEGARMPKLARDGIEGFLQCERQKVMPSVVSMAQNYMKSLGSEPVMRCLGRSSFDLADVVKGEPIDVFVCIPPEKLESHKCLVKFWFGTLLSAVMRRKEIPERRTLFVADEAAQLGKFDLLLTACTLLRGFGLQMLCCWQDLGQIKSRYPEDYSTILNNAGAVVSFGQGHYAAAKDYGELFGVPPWELLNMRRDQAMVSVRGEGTRMIRRLNYLEDGMFAGMYDPNPYFAKKGGRGK
jgi:type IV secretion system protein VirD4